jgi:hypothetical protein
VSVRTGTCACGQLSATCTGDPVRVSVCHCLNCQRRSGSAFAVQARWPDDRVELTGDRNQWRRVGGDGGAAAHFFCPVCGVTIAYVLDSQPGLIAVPVGAFADPDFPPPVYSVYEERKHAWLEISGELEHFP